MHSQKSFVALCAVVNGPLMLAQAAHSVVAKKQLPSLPTPAKRHQAKRYAAAQAKVAGQAVPANLFASNALFAGRK